MIEEKKMDTINDKIYAELLNHIGEKNAISATKLSRMFWISKRNLRTRISEIRKCKEYTKAVGSGNLGYYICSNKEELWKTTKRLYGQINSLLKVVKMQESKGILDGQAKIPTEDGKLEYYSAFGKEQRQGIAE